MRWGYINEEPTVAFVESADPGDLGARLAGLLAAIAGAPEAQSIAAVELAGAGDGHVFTVRVEYGDATEFLAISALVPLVPLFTPIVYMADNVVELAVARDRIYSAAPFPPGLAVIGSEMAGATQGRRVCVLEMLGTVVPPPPPPP